ncbi:hypothetical protein LPTSP4_35960 [Leptospira ryugenii]|uniref:Uncharacterized protein n=1 Tax=Leptospira ryugenii TaxID=1917863 RepID=A0A2P2E5A3_9LEPT|nr:hypothetical protein [Leptospira ryugenii]GBF52058.1 hypothetical protein LPTSP4_35960 [Leptospira ryugenii]
MTGYGYEGTLNKNESNYDYSDLAIKVYPDECRRILFLGEIEEFAEWEDRYDYNPTRSSKFVVRLRKKNVCAVQKWMRVIPWCGSRFIDLRERMVAKFREGVLEAVFVRTPWGGLAPNPVGLQAWRGMGVGGGVFPGA